MSRYGDRTKWLYKMVMIAILNPDKKYYLDFNALNILSLSKDYDWNYECAKTDKVIEFIELAIKNNASKKDKKAVKRVCKQLCENICFYEEYVCRAKYITKKYIKE